MRRCKGQLSETSWNLKFPIRLLLAIHKGQRKVIGHYKESQLK